MGVLMAKARRRASHGGVQYKITVLAANTSAATSIAGKLTETALKAEIAAHGGPQPTAVGTAAAVASTANTTSTTNTTSDDSLSAVPGFRPTMPLTFVVSLLAMFSASGVVMS